MDVKNSNIKISLVIPYKKRIHNLRLVLEALAKQTMAKDEFEVVVGVMEYASEYVALCEQFNDRLNIVSVMINREWQIVYARNAAVNVAQGEVIVLLDVDILLGANVLEDLYNKYYAYGQNQCVIGQMIGYENNTADVTNVVLESFSCYEEKLEEITKLQDKRIDERLKVDCYIPWAFAWTALIALPRKAVIENNLFFDLNFYGYGVEDLEWAYRICEAGIPLSVQEDFWGIHLPHERNIHVNKVTEKINYEYFLKKWPGIDVELACVFGDFEANNQIRFMREELQAATEHKKYSLCTAEVEEAGETVLVIGAIKDENGVFKNLDYLSKPVKIIRDLPLVGLALPYEDKTFSKCYILASIEKLSNLYKNHILNEVTRIAEKIIK